jgi:hypothetical protein
MVTDNLLMPTVDFDGGSAVQEGSALAGLEMQNELSPQPYRRWRSWIQERHSQSRNSTACDRGFFPQRLLLHHKVGPSASSQEGVISGSLQNQFIRGADYEKI